MNNQTNQIRKDDSHLWQLVERLKQEREAAGITEQPFNLDRANALWEKYKESLLPAERGRHYLIVLEPSYPDGFIGCCPAVGYCTVTAPTKELAKEALINKISSRLKDMAKKGQPLPIEQGTVEVVEVAVQL